MNAKPSHSADLFRMRFTYDSATGQITDKVTGRAAFARRADHGYLVGEFLGRRYRAHRVAWALHYGKWPDGEIDHMNRVKDDNRIDNLRDCDHLTNTQNRGLNQRNRTGHRGIGLTKAKRKPFRVQLKIKGQKHCFGSYATLEEAKDARQAAAVKHGIDLD